MSIKHRRLVNADFAFVRFSNLTRFESPAAPSPALRRRIGQGGLEIRIARRHSTRFIKAVAGHASSLLNVGLYNVPEAARLTRISTGKVHRWLRGYSYRKGKVIRHSEPVWQGELTPLNEKPALSFRDLLELRFVDAFIRAGVSWRTMRRAHAKAQEQLKTTHPFCSNRIFTDGRRILLRQGEEDSDQVLIDLASDQAEFARIVEPFRKELEFSGNDIIWWPLGKERQVVINPKRNFGQPSAARSGVPTRVLARSVKTNGRAPWLWHAPNLRHDQLKKQERRLRRLLVAREVR